MQKYLLGFAIVLAAVAALLWFGNNYVLRLATTVAMYIALAVSWNIVGGFSGYPTFATAAFFGLGAYIAAVAQVNGAPIYLSWLTAGALAALFASGLGLSILHLRGHYFAIGSLVIADVLREVINSWTDVTGGGMGLNVPLITPGVDSQAQFFLVTMTVLATLAFAASVWVAKSKLGVALRCIEQNEDAAQIIGVNTRHAKVSAFVISSFFIATAGGIYASWVTYIDTTDVFDISLSVKPIIMVLLGGLGTLIGPVVGAISFLALEELIWRNSLEFHTGILGLIVVALVLFLPAGLTHFRSLGIAQLMKWRRQ